MYLVTVMDWATRFVLSRPLSNCLDAGFFLNALHEALSAHPAPGIFNTAGSRFINAAFTGTVAASGARMSMDGMGHGRNNAVIERFRRSLKTEAVYLHDLVDGLDAHRVISAWLAFHNDARPHSALGGRTPRIA